MKRINALFSIFIGNPMRKLRTNITKATKVLLTHYNIDLYKVLTLSVPYIKMPTNRLHRI